MHFPCHFLFVLLACVLFGHLRALAALMNVTVDDSGIDPNTGASIVYSPPNSWSPGQTCKTCTAHVDPSLAFNHTWHDVLYIPAQNPVLTASLQFDGSAIYVYCVLAHTSSPVDGNSDMTFFIDGQVVGTFLQKPNGDPNFSYNSPVYVNTSISAGKHTFMLQNGKKGGQAALALLDYIVYSRDDTTPISSQSSESNSGSVSTSTSHSVSTSATASTSTDVSTHSTSISTSSSPSATIRPTLSTSASAVTSIPSNLNSAATSTPITPTSTAVAPPSTSINAAIPIRYALSGNIIAAFTLLSFSLIGLYGYS